MIRECYKGMAEKTVDEVIKIGNSLVQHGKVSNRVYVMHLEKGDLQSVQEWVERLAAQKGYTKIFVKAEAAMAPYFLVQNYELEARVPGFDRGINEGFFLGKFLDEARAVDQRAPDQENILKSAQKVSLGRSGKKDRPHAKVSILGEEDSGELAQLYGKVFESYPFPIFDPRYLKKTMKEHVAYYGIRRNGKLVAAASAEMNERMKNVEMTDFATLNSERGKGAAFRLLNAMEEDMGKRGFCTAYTICRALSLGINRTFFKANYQHGGTLVNNTHIAGQIESMQVWYKAL